MKAILITLLLLVAVALSQKTCVTKSTSGEPLPMEILQFLEGFALGVETEIGDIQACTRDANITLADFQHGYLLLKSGFQHINVAEIEQGIQSFADGVREIAVALKDCNVTQLVTDIEHLVADIKEGTAGIIKIIVKEAINIFHHTKELTTDFKNFISFWEQRKWQLAGVQVGKIVGILLNYRM